MKKAIYIPMKAIFYWFLAFGLLTTACRENLDDSQELIADSRPITFTVDDSQDWYRLDATTRATTKQVFSMPVKSLKENGTEKGLFLHSTVVNGINSYCKSDREATRCEAKTALTDNFDIIAYEYHHGDWGTIAPVYTDYATTTDNKTWTLNGTHFWPTDSKVLRFLGISPASAANTIVPAVGDGGDTPKVTITVAKDATQQYDLMTALSKETTYISDGGTITMPFKHALTCVRFAIGSSFINNITITRIRLLNVAQRGTVTIDDSYSWSADATSRTEFKMDGLAFPVTSSVSQNTQIVSATTGANATTLLMIPQVFDNDEQVVELTYKDGSNATHSVSTSLNGQEWLAGTTVTYQLCTEANDYDYVLTVTPPVVGADGGQAAFAVTSYAKSNAVGVADKPLSWRVIGYSTDGLNFFSEKPASCNWAGIMTTSGTGGTEAQNAQMLIDAQSSTSTMTLSRNLTDENYYVTQYRTMLQANGMRGSDRNYYDLSTHDSHGNETACNTANCYVVNAPGYYKLPLVYGNAIKNGEANTSAYGGTAIAHTGGTIGGPYLKSIATPNTGEGSAVMMWQDAEGLVSKKSDEIMVVKEDEDYYLHFIIPYETVQSGNAVLAVKDTNGNIMWSWHIWVTPVDITKTIEVTNLTNYKYYLMPLHLGWVSMDGDLEICPTRSMYVRILQEASGLVATFHVSQQKTADMANYRYGYCPFYQWGRKDPMLPSCGDAMEDHVQDSTSDGTRWTSTTTKPDLATTIKNPNIFYGKNQNGYWTTNQNANLWNANGTTGFSDATIVKTIYDPSPVGYHIPPSNFGTFMASTTSKTSSILAAGSFDRGWNFYTNSTRTRTIYFPSAGSRIQSEGASVNNEWPLARSGYLWAAMRPSVSDGCTVDVENTYVTTNSSHWANHALAVHPVAEEVPNSSYSLARRNY